MRRVRPATPPRLILAPDIELLDPVFGALALSGAWTEPTKAAGVALMRIGGV
jgi:hypothetical protein